MPRSRNEELDKVIGGLENGKLYMKAMFYTDKILQSEGYDSVENAENLGKMLAMEIQRKGNII